jgi:hypothetical protein
VHLIIYLKPNVYIVCQQHLRRPRRQALAHTENRTLLKHLVQKDLDPRCVAEDVAVSLQTVADAPEASLARYVAPSDALQDLLKEAQLL